MKNILLISAAQVFPALSGGQMRSASFATALSELGYEVLVFCLTGRKNEYLKGRKDERLNIQANLDQAVCRSKVNGLLQFLCYRLATPDLWLDHRFWRWLIPEELRKAIERADLVVFDLPYTTRLRCLAQNKPCFLLSHNIESQRWQGFTSAYFYQRVKTLERRAAHSVDLVLACAEADAHDYRSLGAKECLVIPNGILPSQKANTPEIIRITRQKWGIQDDEVLLVFTASRYAPNLVAWEGLLQFHKEHVDVLRAWKIKLLVAGSVADRAEVFGQMIVTGPVDDMEPYLAAANAAMNPVTSGSGTNIKMFEYLAWHLPILTTDFGRRGLELDDGDDVLVFADGNLLSGIERFKNLDRDGRARMSQSAFHKNRQKIFMKDIVKKGLEQRIRRLVA